MGAMPSTVRAGLGGEDRGGSLHRLPGAVVDVPEFWGQSGVMVEVAVAAREIGELGAALAPGMRDAWARWVGQARFTRM